MTRVAALVLLCLCGSASEAVASPGVLVIFSDERFLSANQEFEAGMRRALGLPQAEIEYSSEFLDVTRFSEPDAGPRWRDFIKGKYAGHDIRVVVAASTPSLDFMIRFRTDLFPDRPLLVAAVPQTVLATRTLPPGTIVLPMDYDFAGTVRHAHQLQPSATEVVVPVGTNANDAGWEERVRREVAPPAGALPVRFLKGLSLDETKREVSRLTNRSIVLLVPINRDGAGSVRLPSTTNAETTSASGAPVYTVFSPQLGTGIVGGQMVTFTRMAEETVAIVQRLLNGERVETITPPAAPIPRFVVDWRQLQRHGLDEARLPADAEIRFKTPSVWQQYRTIILVAAALILLQAVSLVALLVQRRLRDAAEKQAQVHRNDLAHLSRVSLMGELSASLAHELNQPLTAILSNAQAAARFLEAEHPDLDTVRDIVRDIADDDRRAGEVIRRLRELLKKGQPQLQPLHCRDLVTTVLRVAKSDLEIRDVTVSTNLAADLPLVNGDPVQLQQVLLNLVINAADALRALPAPERRVTIAATTREGQQVELSVSDRGHGIAEGDLQAVFQPFFTTKAEGLGMGLSISRSIVEAHGGRLWAANNPGGGATFYVVLPA
jgi:signal transduction histidine kinase